MRTVWPVADLLDQWLLLPLFADLGLLLVVLRSVRNRTGYALAALLALLALDTVAATWPEVSAMPELRAACRAFLPALVVMFLLSYTGGRRLAGRGGRWALLLAAPPALFAAYTIGSGMPASGPATPLFSLCFFGAGLLFLFLSGAARALSVDESPSFLAAIMMMVGSGPVYELALPHFGMELELFPYLSAAAGALLARVALRYKSFSVAPAAERPGPGGGPRPAGLFIARTGEARRARAVFAAASRAGVPGAIVTRTHPVAFRRQTGLGNVPVIWLANSSYEKALPPAAADVLSHSMRDMGEQAAGCMILIEDLDYLVTNAGLFPTLDMLQEVRSQAERSSMTVILSSDLLTDEERRELRGLGIMPLPREGGAAAQM